MRHSAPTTVAPTRVARRTRAPTGLNPDARRLSTGRLATTPTPTPTRLRGRAYAQAPVGPAASAARHPRPRVCGGTVATDDGEPPPPPNRDWAARPPTAPAAWAVALARARKRPRSPNRGSPSSDLTGTVRISRWRYVAYLCYQLAISHE